MTAPAPIAPRTTRPGRGARFATHGLAALTLVAAWMPLAAPVRADSPSSASVPAPAILPASPSVRQLAFTGDLAARLQVKVFSRVAGIVKELRFREGSVVRAGDILARIDPEEYAIEVQDATASVQEARARLAAMEHGGRAEERARAEADLASEEAVLHNERENLDRQSRMFQKGGVARTAVDAAQRAFDVAQARVVSAQKALAMVREGPRDEEKQASRAQLARAQATLAMARLKLSYCEVHAPFDGVVGQRLVDEGAYLLAASSPQAPALCVLSDASVLRALVDVPESDLLLVRLGEPAQIEVQASPGQAHPGRTFNLFPYVDPRTRTSKLEIEVQNHDGQLLPGMFVKARMAAAGKAAVSVAQILARRPPDPGAPSGQDQAGVQVPGPNGERAPAR